MVSARFGVLSAPLNSTVSVCSKAVCGQTCGQKALLDQVRHPLPPPVQKGSFSYSGLGYCTSAEAEKQEVFSSQAYQFLTRLYKEYGLEESPQLFLVCLQLDLVVGEWIAGQKIQ